MVEVLFYEIDGRALGVMQLRVGGAALRDRGHVVWSAGEGAVLRD